MSDIPTPITDALSTDPAIDRRDVPARVWREMARLEREHGELLDVVRGFMSVAKAGRMKAWRDAEALLARLGKE